MPFTENLDAFFDIRHFAVAASFRNETNVEVRPANVIFTNSAGAALMFDNQALAALPFIQCKTADLDGIDNSSRIVINSIAYKIVERSDRGSGTSLVQLRKLNS